MDCVRTFIGISSIATSSKEIANEEPTVLKVESKCKAIILTRFTREVETTDALAPAWRDHGL
jgi:hypothetical protein